MKSGCPSIVFLMAFMFSVNAKSQVYNLSLTDSTQPVIYHGTPNHFRIAGVKSTDDVLVKSGYGRINTYDFETGEFSYDCRSTAVNFDTLKIYNNGKLIYVRRYEIKIMPVPQVKMGTLRLITDTISVNDILQNNQMTVEMPGCSYKHEQYIESFILEISDAYGILIKEFPRTTGNTFTIDQLKELKQLVPGQCVIIRKARANCKKCAMPGTLPPLTILIKN